VTVSVEPRRSRRAAATRQRVIDAAKASGYRPHAAATSG